LGPDVTGRDLPGLLNERLFHPMGIEHAEWDRVSSGAAFGFHGLHLTTEAVAAFGELLLRGGRWGDRQLVPRSWVERATRRHIATTLPEGMAEADGLTVARNSLHGYGYQFWRSEHGYRGEGNLQQLCVVVPSHDLVVAATGAVVSADDMLEPLWEELLPGLDDPGDAEVLADRLRRLSLGLVPGSADAGRGVTATLDGAVLPGGTTVTVEPAYGGWVLRFGSLFAVEAGHGAWRESAPLGRPVVTSGAWQGNTYVAELFVITTPHRVRLTVDASAGTAVARWNHVPLTGPNLLLHLTCPLMTRPDVA
jgi:hypothetical protein